MLKSILVQFELLAVLKKVGNLRNCFYRNRNYNMFMEMWILEDSWYRASRAFRTQTIFQLYAKSLFADDDIELLHRGICKSLVCTESVYVEMYINVYKKNMEGSKEGRKKFPKWIFQKGRPDWPAWKHSSLFSVILQDLVFTPVQQMT